MAANVLIWLQLMPCILKKKYVKNISEPHNYEKPLLEGHTLTHFPFPPNIPIDSCLGDSHFKPFSQCSWLQTP